MTEHRRKKQRGKEGKLAVLGWNWVKEAIRKKVRTWKADDWKACLVLAGGFFVLTVSTFLGEIHRREAGERGKQSFTKESSSEDGFIQVSGLPGDLISGNLREGMMLGQEQIKFLQQFEAAMAGASVHQAADRLNQEKNHLQEILTAIGKITGQEVLYLNRGEPTPSLNGMGLAICENTTCFYGNFRDGKPDGVCTAIACLDGEDFAYVYSMGIWENGEMEGLGITGRYSRKKKEQGSGLEEQVSGIFQGDCLNGRLTYEQIDAQGRSCWWEIMAEGGKTCLDQRWVFWEGLGEYRLSSEKEERAFFVLPESFLGQVWWRNRVPWE